MFNVDTFAWLQPKVGGFAPSPRYGHSLTLLADGRLIMFGGTSIEDGRSVPCYNDDVRVCVCVCMSLLSVFFISLALTNPLLLTPHCTLPTGAPARHGDNDVGSPSLLRAHTHGTFRTFRYFS